MGDKSVDIVLFALVAAFFGYQLWRVLGRRGDEAGRPEMPRPVDQTAAKPAAARPTSPFRPQIIEATPLKPMDPLSAGIAEIKASDPGFTPDGFLSGARQAFEFIVKAYAEGDTATLRPLIGDEVYDSFAEAIRHRLAEHETVETRIVRLDPPSLTDAHMDGRTAIVSVRFVSSQISVTRGADGSIVEGDPEHPVERSDIWTFCRNTRSSNPNWSLVGTEHG